MENPKEKMIEPSSCDCAAPPPTLHSSVSEDIKCKLAAALRKLCSFVVLPQLVCTPGRPLLPLSLIFYHWTLLIGSRFPSVSSRWLQTRINSKVENCCSPDQSTESLIWSGGHEVSPGMLLRSTAKIDSLCSTRKFPQGCFAAAAAATQCCFLIHKKKITRNKTM